MFIENGCRIDSVQIELNIIELFFWANNFYKNSFKKKRKIFCNRIILKNSKINKRYFKFLKVLIPEIFIKLGFFQPLLFCNKPWVLYWLLNTLDIIYVKIKKNLAVKNINQAFIFLPKINLSQIFKESNSSLFSLYSAILYSTLTPDIDNLCVEYKIIKSIYYFIKSLTKNSLLARNSKNSDCDGRNLFCIFIVSSLLGILTSDLESIIIRETKHLSITREGFSTKKFSGTHGAISYCWIASLLFLKGEEKKLVLPFDIKKWLSIRQNFLTYGFSGRLSKTPDSCYNFWIGASLIFLNIKFSKNLENNFIFCNDKISNGFSDRSGKIIDFYHICYSICGFATLNFLNSFESYLKGKSHQKIKKFNCFWNLAKLNPLYGLRESRNTYYFSLTGEKQKNW